MMNVSIHSNTADKKKLLVFDRFYKEDFDLEDIKYLREEGGGLDAVKCNLNHDRHEVVASAKSIAEACELLLALKDGEIEDIDAIILGGTLDGDHTYSHQPVSFTRTVATTKKKMFRGSKEVFQDKITHLLPSYDSEDNIILPETAPGQGIRRERYAGKNRASSVAAFVLSHTVKELFDEKNRPKTILFSTDANMPENAELPVDARVMKSYRWDPDSTLSQTIDQLVQ